MNKKPADEVGGGCGCNRDEDDDVNNDNYDEKL